MNPSFILRTPIPPLKNFITDVKYTFSGDILMLIFFMKRTINSFFFKCMFYKVQKKLAEQGFFQLFT
ncbi:hypothetical protein D7Z54_11530 [Salibacterium salarium]|uniref:Uncharacterized protein n=1 Tax=Salibacterium salarium TaxID=284579 RepID=A0A3R9WTI2_9BACI|nr:hypothetical protein D7Z54_11530 [Salibacterium salarium]